jgi:hypothetical protein
MAKVKSATSTFSWDDLSECIEEVLVNLRDAQADITAKEKNMIDTYLAEADDQLHKAMKICFAITQKLPRARKK